MPILGIRLYLEFGGAAALVLAFALFVHHERTVGAATLRSQVAQAQAVAHAQAVAATAAAQAKLDKAHQDATNAQTKLDTYIAGVQLPATIRVCSSPRSAGVPQTSIPTPGVASTSPGSGTVPEVFGGSNDIKPALDTVVRVAGRLAVVYAECQQR